jgi:hypothetical protein
VGLSSVIYVFDQNTNVYVVIRRDRRYGLQRDDKTKTPSIPKRMLKIYLNLNLFFYNWRVLYISDGYRKYHMSMVYPHDVMLGCMVYNKHIHKLQEELDE